MIAIPKSRTLARALLGKDGMECAAIDDLEKIAKEQVRNFANAPARDVGLAARALGLQIIVLNASTSREINAAFATFVGERPDALFVGTDPFFTNRRIQLAKCHSGVV